MSIASRKRILNAVEAASWGRASDFSESGCRNTELYDQEINEEQDASRLQYLTSCLFATVLEDVITQLRILDVCNTELRLRKTMAEITALLADKFGIEKKAVTDELDDIDQNNLNCIEYKLNKLQADREFVMRILSETYLSLCTEKRFHPLTDAVNHIVQNTEHLIYITQEEIKNKLIRRESHRQLRQQRNHFKSLTYDTNNEIEFLKSQVEDAELNAEIRSRYVGGWQLARTEQHLQIIFNEEDKPTQTIEELKRRVEQEQRVHTEIELLTNIRINEVLEKIEEWMGKYDKDIEGMDMKIQIKKNDYENMRSERLGLEEMIAKRAELIKNWVTFKEEREALRKYREKMNNSAITIQAWWRGLLVRKQLGPYKVSKKKGAKAGEKSKNKK